MNTEQLTKSMEACVLNPEDIAKSVALKGNLIRIREEYRQKFGTDAIISWMMLDTLENVSDNPKKEDIEDLRALIKDLDRIFNRTEGK